MDRHEPDAGPASDRDRRQSGARSTHETAGTLTSSQLDCHEAPGPPRSRSGLRGANFDCRPVATNRWLRGMRGGFWRSLRLDVADQLDQKEGEMTVVAAG